MSFQAELGRLFVSYYYSYSIFILCKTGGGGGSYHLWDMKTSELCVQAEGVPVIFYYWPVMCVCCQDVENLDELW